MRFLDDQGSVKKKKERKKKDDGGKGEEGMR